MRHLTISHNDETFLLLPTSFTNAHGVAAPYSVSGVYKLDRQCGWLRLSNDEDVTLRQAVWDWGRKNFERLPIDGGFCELTPRGKRYMLYFNWCAAGNPEAVGPFEIPSLSGEMSTESWLWAAVAHLKPRGGERGRDDLCLDLSKPWSSL